MGGPPSYGLITPARDESDNLPRLAAGLAAQTVLPAAWVIVDNGSTDGTAEIAAEIAREHPWVTVLTTGGRGNADPRRANRAGFPTWPGCA